MLCMADGLRQPQWVECQDQGTPTSDTKPSTNEPQYSRIPTDNPDKSLDHTENGSQMKGSVHKETKIPRCPSMGNQDSAKVTCQVQNETLPSKSWTLKNGTSPHMSWVNKYLSKTCSKSANSSSLGPLIAAAQRNYLLEKIVFLISMVTIVLLAYGLLCMPWLLPYYYAISAPSLYMIRVVRFWKFKWQLYLIDFCYFANFACYIFIWAFPQESIFFAVLFGISNGPLALALPIFRGSLVLHDMDKMKSVHIHVLPAFLTFSIRWFSSSTSSHWFKPFVNTYVEDVPHMILWVVAVPLGLFIVHSFLYVLVVDVILRPGEEYGRIYQDLVNSPLVCLLNLGGPNYKYVKYHIFLWLFVGTSLLCAGLVYKYFIAHCIYIILLCILPTWNGGSYYVEVYGNNERRNKALQEECELEVEST